MSFSTMHSSAMWGTCKTCGAWVSVRSNTDQAQISGLAMRETCAQVKADRPEEYTEKMNVNGRRVPCRRLGEWADEKGRRYTAWRSAVNNMSAYVRLEPFDGGRARMCYDAGGTFARMIERAQEEAQAGA
jgi:hypothetical protein